MKLQIKQTAKMKRKALQQIAHHIPPRLHRLNSTQTLFSLPFTSQSFSVKNRPLKTKFSMNRSSSPLSPKSRIRALSSLSLRRRDIKRQLTKTRQREEDDYRRQRKKKKGQQRLTKRQYLAWSRAECLAARQRFLVSTCTQKPAKCQTQIKCNSISR